MNNKIANRKVKMLRCHVYPTGIGPKPANAITPSSFNAEAYVCDEASVGIILRDPKRDHDDVIPWSIIEHAELEKETTTHGSNSKVEKK